MEPTLSDIIERIAAQADDVLAGASNRAEARAGIEESITADYLWLAPGERAVVVTGVMNILEAEGFFAGDQGEAPPLVDD